MLSGQNTAISGLRGCFSKTWCFRNPLVWSEIWLSCAELSLTSSQEQNNNRNMKRTFTLFALVAICFAMTVSCKNAKKSAPTQEEIAAQKQALADSVLAEIDSLTDHFFDVSSKSFILNTLGLTTAEKMVKPDYLLDPALVGNFVTKTQKVNALAFYIVDYGVRRLYDMPQEENKEAIAKLAADLNHPIDIDFMTSKEPGSEKLKIRKEYEICRERGDVAYFWHFQNAVMVETGYVMSQNPEIFLSKITEEQWQCFCARMSDGMKAVEELAPYDEEMAQIKENRSKNRVAASDEERVRRDNSKEAALQYYLSHKDEYAAIRNSILQ